MVNAIEIRSVESTSSVQLKARLVGVNDVINEIIVYPNPVRIGETIFATMPNAVHSNMVSLEIYNTLGSKRMEHKYEGNSLGVLEFHLDSGAVVTGVYLIRVTLDGNTVKTQKLIVR